MSPQIETAGSADDDALMQEIASGDEKAARTVVERHLPVLVAVARQMLGSEAEAEDVAQEAFLRLWKLADKWQPGRALILTWLRRVTVNLCIDRLRQNRTKPLTPQDDQPVAADQLLAVEEEQLRKRVNEALEQLPERQRQAVTLSHYQGLSQAQAAALMDISEHALESLLARARRALKAALEAEWRGLLPDGADGGGI